MSKHPFVMSLISVALVLLFIGHADACRCRPPAPPKESLEKSLGVFEGKVTAIKVEGRMLLATVAVSQSWKGEPAKEVTVRTNSSSAACGVSFQEGKSYVIYCTGKNDAGWATNLCTRTRPLAQAKEDLEALGPGEMPE